MVRDGGSDWDPTDLPPVVSVRDVYVGLESVVGL